MHKKRTLFLAGLLAVSLLAGPVSAASFPDVAMKSAGGGAIDYVSDRGIMVGDAHGNFNPAAIVNRAQMATIVCRVLNQTENLPKSEVFTDVPTSHWANVSIAKASQLGIVNGYKNGSFGPSDPVTYEQAVTMVVRAIGREEAAQALGGYPNGYLQAAEANGLLKELHAVRGAGMTRGNVALLLYNYYTTQNSAGASSEEHTHQYVEQTAAGSGAGGHYEQVQVGTEQVLVRNEKVQYYWCYGCEGKFYSYEAWEEHGTPGSPTFRGCMGHSLIYTEYVPVYEEQPIYENKWVEDGATVIRVCTICGAQA